MVLFKPTYRLRHPEKYSCIVYYVETTICESKHPKNDNLNLSTEVLWVRHSGTVHCRCVKWWSLGWTYRWMIFVLFTKPFCFVIYFHPKSNHLYNKTTYFQVDVSDVLATTKTLSTTSKHKNAFKNPEPWTVAKCAFVFKIQCIFCGYFAPDITFLDYEYN